MRTGNENRLPWAEAYSFPCTRATVRPEERAAPGSLQARLAVFMVETGESRTPVQKTSPPEMCYRLIRLLSVGRCVAAGGSASAQAILLRRSHRRWSAATPESLRPPSTSEIGWGGGRAALVRLQLLVACCQLLFCRLINEGDGTSACNPRRATPCRNRASPHVVSASIVAQAGLGTLIRAFPSIGRRDGSFPPRGRDGL